MLLLSDFKELYKDTMLNLLFVSDTIKGEHDVFYTPTFKVHSFTILVDNIIEYAIDVKVFLGNEIVIDYEFDDEMGQNNFFHYMQIIQNIKTQRLRDK